MLPVKETKELLRPIYSLIGALAAAGADGKISLADVGLFIPVITQLGPAVENVGQVPAELADLTEAEQKELLADAAVYLPTATAPELSAKVTAALQVALAVARAVSVFKGTAVVNPVGKPA